MVGGWGGGVVGESNICKGVLLKHNFSIIILISTKDSQIKTQFCWISLVPITLPGFLHKCSKNSDWPYGSLNLELFIRNSDWAFKNLLRSESQAKDLPSDFACNTHRFGWMPAFFWGPWNTLWFLSLPGNGLPFSPRKATGNPVSKVPGRYYQGALLVSWSQPLFHIAVWSYLNLCTYFSNKRFQSKPWSCRGRIVRN